MTKPEEEARRLFIFFFPFLTNYRKLDYYNVKSPQILWFFNLTNKVLQAAYKVQSCGIHMLWVGRKDFLLLERKNGHRVLQSSFPDKSRILLSWKHSASNLTSSTYFCVATHESLSNRQQDAYDDSSTVLKIHICHWYEFSRKAARPAPKPLLPAAGWKDRSANSPCRERFSL